jgi:hypothetical protein
MAHGTTRKVAVTKITSEANMESKRAWIERVCAIAVMSCGAVLSAQSANRPNSADPAALALRGSGATAKDESLKVLRVPTGDTLPAKGESGVYERVLLTAPDENTMATGAAHDLSFDEAIRLARLPHDERWRELRKTLGLAPDDLLVWSEMVDAIFDSLTDLTPQSRSKDADFGLQISFPGTDTTNAKPDTLLTLGKSTEDRMKDAVNDAATGIEGFVEVAGGDAAESVEALHSLECQLLDRAKTPVATSPIREGYCAFPHLKVNPAFGRNTYYVRIAATSKDFKVSEGRGQSDSPPQVVAYVLTDQRTRVSFKVTLEHLRGATPTTTATVSTDPTTMIQGFTKGLPLLDGLVQGLPPNPGLHIGAVEVPGSGTEWLFSLRYYLRAPVVDRRPHFVKNPHGTIHLQCVTPLSPEAAAGQHYLRIVWSARAEPSELTLSSRPASEFPVGVSVGVVPALNPVVYSVGASYKLLPALELVAAAGIRKGRATVFIYGFTIDLQNVLSILVGSPPKSAGGSGSK